MELTDHLWQLLGWACKTSTTAAILTERTATVLDHGTPLAIRIHDLGFWSLSEFISVSTCDKVPTLALKLVVTGVFMADLSFAIALLANATALYQRCLYCTILQKIITVVEGNWSHHRREYIIWTLENCNRAWSLLKADCSFVTGLMRLLLFWFGSSSCKLRLHEVKYYHLPKMRTDA